MKNKIVSLLDMVKLSDSDSLSEKYVRYICGIEPERQYKHQEILDVKINIDTVKPIPPNIATETSIFQLEF